MHGSATPGQQGLPACLWPTNTYKQNLQSCIATVKSEALLKAAACVSAKTCPSTLSFVLLYQRTTATPLSFCNWYGMHA